MVFIKKDKEGNYYLYVGNNNRAEFKETRHYKRNIFLIKNDSAGNRGYVGWYPPMFFPKELIGKRIKFKIEIVK